MKLYGFGQSRSFRVLWTLEEAGLAYEYFPVVFGSDEGPLGNRSAAYKEVNTQGKVPTLIDGDLKLTESGAAVSHVARQAPDRKLIPANNPKLLARYEEILFFVLSDFEQPLWSNGKHRFALPEERRLPQMLDVATWEFQKAQQALHVHLNGNNFAVGDNFSAADIVIAHTINWAERFGFPVDQVFLDYRDRHYQRPAAQKALSLVS